MSLYDFYRTKKWEQFRQALINERTNKNGEIKCEKCGKPIVKAYDIILHHTVELTEENHLDANISLNPNKIKLVHHRCHNLIHEKLAYTQKQVFIVYGAPLSGKSKYVKEISNIGDLIVDLDNIWQCVSGCERYIKPNRLTSVVFSVRDNLIESIRYRRGKWINAYIIGGFPYEMERQRLARELNAKEIFIEASEEECMQRLCKCEDRDKKEWEKNIKNWFLQYSGKY